MRPNNVSVSEEQPLSLWVNDDEAVVVELKVIEVLAVSHWVEEEKGQTPSMEAGYPCRAKLPRTKTRGFRPAFAGLPGRLTATKKKK